MNGRARLDELAAPATLASTSLCPRLWAVPMVLSTRFGSWLQGFLASLLLLEKAKHLVQMYPLLVFCT